MTQIVSGRGRLAEEEVAPNKGGWANSDSGIAARAVTGLGGV